jgi:hypothetical protein
VPESAHELGPVATGSPRHPTSSQVPGPRDRRGTEIDRTSLQSNQVLWEITQSPSVHFSIVSRFIRLSPWNACKHGHCHIAHFLRLAAPVRSGVATNNLHRMVYVHRRRSTRTSIQHNRSDNRDSHCRAGLAKSGRMTIRDICLDEPVTARGKAVECSVAVPITGHLASRFRGRPAPALGWRQKPLPVRTRRPRASGRGDRAHPAA